MLNAHKASADAGIDSHRLRKTHKSCTGAVDSHQAKCTGMVPYWRSLRVMADDH